jgi:phospholipase A1/A2
MKAVNCIRRFSAYMTFQTLISLSLCLVMLLPGAMVYGSENRETAAGQNGEDVHHTIDSLFSEYQPYLDNMVAYEPIYFLRGIDPEKSKFQLSLKYRFINPSMSIARKHPWIQGFYLAYTQTSFWDLASYSKPFNDTSYKPEVFFVSPNLFSGRGPAHFFLQIGGQHESNGKEEDSSRSTNIIYVYPIFAFLHQKTGYGIMIAPKIWKEVDNSNSGNPDLYHYRGYFDLGFKFGKADGAVFETHWRLASKGNSFRADLSFPLERIISTHLKIYLHAQYVDSLAESMLHYQDRTHALRIGFSIVR